MSDRPGRQPLQQSVLEDVTLRSLAWSVTLALVSRLRAIFAPRSATAAKPVERFYRDARGQEEKYEIVDLARSPYRRLLDGLSLHVPSFLAPSAKILDLGCGDLHLLHHLDRQAARPAAYWGVDVLAPSEQARRLQGPRYGFETLDLQLATFAPPFAPNIVFSSNALCYVREPAPILERAVSLLEPGGSIVLLEPLPSLFWETYFRGIHLQLRPRGYMQPILENLGLKHVGDHVLYALRVGSIPVWPVAYLTVFQSGPNADPPAAGVLAEPFV